MERGNHVAGAVGIALVNPSCRCFPGEFLGGADNAKAT
jgi:hypothetical protein